MDMQLRNPTTANPAPVIALDRSGAGGGQWRQLGTVVDARHEVAAPQRCGCESSGPWRACHAFVFADEAARIIEIIDRAGCKVHLVGHFYGWGVALHADAERANRFANLVLSTFQLLKETGARGAAAFAKMLASNTAEGLITGDYSGAAISFVDYWGRQAWIALRPSVQAALTRWAAHHAQPVPPHGSVAQADIRINTDGSKSAGRKASAAFHC